MKNIKQRLRALVKDLPKSFVYQREGAILHFTESMLCRMKELGINQSRLARELGVSRAYVSRVISGSENLTLETMVRIAMALKTDIRPILRVRGVDVLQSDFAKKETAAFLKRATSLTLSP